MKTGLNVVNADIQAMTCEEDVKGMVNGVALNTPLGSTVSIKQKTNLEMLKFLF